MFENTRAVGSLAVSKGLDFQERMAGPVAFDSSDALVAARLGDARGDEMALRLKVEIDDLDAFLADRRHRAVVSGSVDCQILGGVLPIEHGSLALLPRTGTGTGRATTMEYLLDFADLTGRELSLVGIKTVRDDPGLDLWRDTTTLDVALFPRQHDLNDSPSEGLGTPLLSGQLRLSLPSFLRQLTTFHATATRPLGRVRTARAFGAFFLHRLAEVYLGPRDTAPSLPAAGRPASRAPRETGDTVSEFAGWPDGAHPEDAYVFAHNERIVPAPPEQVWDQLVDAQSWPEFYANAHFVELADPQQHRLQHGSVFRWVTFGQPLTSEVDLCEPPSRIGWRWYSRWWRTGAHGYHVWLLEPHEHGTRIVTEETQVGALLWLGRPISRRLLLFWHGRWLRELGRRATRSPQSARAKGALL